MTTKTYFKRTFQIKMNKYKKMREKINDIKRHFNEKNSDNDKIGEKLKTVYKNKNSLKYSSLFISSSLRGE